MPYACQKTTHRIDQETSQKVSSTFSNNQRRCHFPKSAASFLQALHLRQPKWVHRHCIPFSPFGELGFMFDVWFSCLGFLFLDQRKTFFLRRGMVKLAVNSTKIDCQFGVNWLPIYTFTSRLKTFCADLKTITQGLKTISAGVGAPSGVSGTGSGVISRPIPRP